eukprot:TRINITY_DN4173_c0_g4_i1.p1 TRINITY_DN4173_c0_g4~~TRINITY_DN4173_c0_g4_i1.p1  ORF type:complete len:367 (+),score=80.57 TRINITY_DN4173_c0_g4_i1:52-1152(+)
MHPAARSGMPWRLALALLPLLACAAESGGAELGSAPGLRGTAAEANDAPSASRGLAERAPREQRKAAGAAADRRGAGDEAAEPSDAGTLPEQLHAALHAMGPRQALLALSALVLGMTLVFRGDLGLTVLVVSVTAVAVGIATVAVLREHWQSDLESDIRGVAGVLGGLLAGFAALRGIDGALILLGAALGAAAATVLEPAFLPWAPGDDGDGSPSSGSWPAFALYATCIVVAAVAMDRRVRLRWMLVVAPLVGGALASSSVSFGLTEFATSKVVGDQFAKAFPDLRPVRAPWVEFLALLWKPHAKDVGIFATSSYRLNLGQVSLPLDRAAGIALWLVLFLLGVVTQCRMYRSQKTASKDTASRDRA